MKLLQLLTADKFWQRELAKYLIEAQVELHYSCKKHHFGLSNIIGWSSKKYNFYIYEADYNHANDLYLITSPQEKVAQGKYLKSDVRLFANIETVITWLKEK